MNIVLCIYIEIPSVCVLESLVQIKSMTRCKSSYKLLGRNSDDQDLRIHNICVDLPTTEA